MAVSFDNIPSNLRTPGFFIEFNNELAGALSLEFKVMMFGQRLDTGTVIAGQQTRVNNKNEAERFYGKGSMLATMVKHFKAANPNMELWCIASDDEDAAGNAAAGSIEIAGTPAVPGTLNVMIAGQRIRIAVAQDEAVTDLANKLATAIEDDFNLPVSASASAGVVSLECKWKGETGNDIDVRFNYYTGEETPSGLAITTAPMSGGTANPDLSGSIAALGDEWWNWIVSPYTDVPNLNLLELELDDRWGPMRQMGGRAFTAIRGTQADTGAFGALRNSQHTTIMGTNVTPQPPYVWAAVNAAVASASLSIDPARPLQTLVLDGLLAPSREVVWTQSERNVLLFDGIATYTVARDGKVAVERQITTYQRNAAGQGDASYLDINTPETLERVRYEQRVKAAQIYPRHKLAGDDIRVGAGQAIVRPKDIQALLLDLYRGFETKGWLEDYAQYKASLIVERDVDDRNRINVNDQPNLVNQFRVYAQKTQFVV